MSLPGVLAPLAATLLVLAAVPLSAVRRVALALLTVTLRAVLVSAVASCGVFAVCPDLAPVELAAAAGQILAAAKLPIPVDHVVALWLGLGGLLLAAGLPFLAHLEYARKAAAIARLFDALHRQAAAALEAVRQSTGQPPEVSVAKRSYPDGDVAAGVAVLRAVLNDTHHRPPAAARPTLVKDVLRAESR
jgi:hypothetical protein